jgi:SAM-dependent methyltransferase
MSSSGHSGCRFCGSKLEHIFVDLGVSPLVQSFLSSDKLNQMEPFYPLQVFVCDKCFLVQLQEFVAPENIFSDYLYFASYSDTWLAHAKRYTDEMVRRFPISEASLVIEIASNDGYLLQYFAEKNIPVLGVEPAANVAQVAAKKGISSITKFFSRETAKELVAAGKRADLLLGNNVLAHVPDVNDFVEGMKILLKPQGVITMEFPHLIQLMEQNQFDTIYHEHFSYFSFLTVQKIFAAHGLTLFDVEELPTHGGSLRIFARHAEDSTKPVGQAVTDLCAREETGGYARLETYSRFAEQVKETKRKLLEFLINAKRNGKKIAAYGAAAKGNTLLNYCAIRTDFLDYTVDRSPYKQGMFLP